MNVFVFIRVFVYVKYKHIHGNNLPILTVLYYLEYEGVFSLFILNYNIINHVTVCEHVNVLLRFFDPSDGESGKERVMTDCVLSDYDV